MAKKTIPHGTGHVHNRRKPQGKAKHKTVVPSQPTDLEYIKLFNDCVIKKEKLGAIDKLIDDKIIANKSRYQEVSNLAGGGISVLSGFSNNAFGSVFGNNNLFGNSSNLLGNAAGATGQPAFGGTVTGSGFMGAADPFMPAAGMPALSLNPGGVGNNWPFGGLQAMPTTFSTGGIPWYFIACAHYLECGLSFAKHLHNGDPLTRYTTHVPANRPQVGHPPPFTFEESAVDALQLMGLTKISSWTLPTVLRKLEGYNGFGYYKYKHINTPYLWSFSNQYTSGKYVSDGHYDATAVSGQMGAAVILKRMEERSLIYIPRN